MAGLHRASRVFAPTWAVLWLSLGVGCQTGQSAASGEVALAAAATEAQPQVAAEPAPIAADATPATADEAGGRIIPAPANLRSFAPAESGVAVDADEVSLRQVFEDLGPDATMWYQHVQTLANPFFEGRAPGTRGSEIAAEYLEFYFRKYGLEPAFPADQDQLGGETERAWVSYRQPFDFNLQGRSVQVEITEAQLSIDGEALSDGEEFVVLGNSGTGEVTAPLSFVGYGIADGRDGYSSFDEDTDLTGRIALLLRYEPLNADGTSQWSTQRFSRQARLGRKMRSVADRGAAGILLVNPPNAAQGRRGLEPIERSRQFGPGMDIPVMQIRPEVADRLLQQADSLGRDLMAWRRLADTAEVTTADLDDAVQLTAVAEVVRTRDRQEFHSENIGGILHGNGDLADQWIVIGGHYDHVGYGHLGTDPSDGRLHPGADDNASGTAGVLILARRFAAEYAEADPDDPLRSILFLAFTAEESGLNGSRYFVDHSTISPSAIMAMVNMDMIGRLRSHELMVSGIGTAQEFETLLGPHFDQSGLTIATSPGGRGPSDHANFYGADIPVLFVFTGMHAEYHSPSDYAYTVNPAGAGQVLDLVHAIVLDLATQPQMLTFTARSGGPSGRPGYAKVRLGVVPAFGDQTETGVLIDDVSEGGSAAEGGIRPGDVLVAWNGTELDGLGGMIEQMRTHEPGDVVTITVERDGQRIDLEVTLQASERER